MLSANNLQQVNKALQNSFSNIKRDMNELKLLLGNQTEQYAELRKDIESIKTDSVTKDKMNVLKIKIGEINEGLKKVWDVEKQVKALHAPSLDKKNIQASIDDINGKLIAAELKLNETSKKSASETQLRTVVSGINAELSNLAAEIRNVEIRKNELGKIQIENYENRVANRINASTEAIDELRKEIKTYVHKQELKSIISEMNNDFDSVRKELASVQKEQKACIKQTEVQSLVKNIDKEFDGLTNSVETLQKKSKDFVTINQIKGLIDDVSKEFDEIRAELRQMGSLKSAATQIKNLTPKKDVEELKKSYSSLQAEVKEMQDKKDKRGENYGASVVLKDYVPAKKIKTTPLRKTRAFGNLLIIASFLLLVGSIVSYYLSEIIWMDNFAISAVASFILGIALRMFSVIKAK